MADELIKVPDIGGAEGAEVVEVLVSPGDAIDVEQSLVVVESDKASMEIPAPIAGVVSELRVAVGDSVSEGDVILALAAESGAAGTDDAPATAEQEGVDASSQDDQEASERTKASEMSAEGAAGQGQDPAAAPSAPASTSASGLEDAATVIDVVIPDLGSDEGADLVELLVPVGGQVEEGDSLVLLESDKASMEVPAPAAGTVTEWLMETGTMVKEGAVIARLAIDGASTPSMQSEGGTNGAQPEPLAPGEQREENAQATAVTAAALVSDEDASHLDTHEVATLSAPRGGERPAALSEPDAVYAGPAVRKLAREFGVTLSQVKGTGARGRILKEDLQQHVAQALAAEPSSNGAGLPAIPEQDYARFGAIEKTARSRIDKVTANNMVRSWLNIPHVTQFDDADISDMERFRKELKSEAADRGVRLTPLPFILKACAVALREHPKLKSSLADGGETLVMKHYCHIGMAVDTPAGLVVPVLRDVDKKSIWELAAETVALAERARDKQLRPDDMQGGVFTVSSLGAIGGRGFTPIINAPEVAILGVGRAAVQPVWDGEVFRPQTLLPLALSYDHRVVNGGDGGRFLTELTSLLGDVKRMVM
ncbi:MAG: Dihydrolipoyllysine-residue acetyltransferase component of pyruvate dehydrogenase complex [Halieaceae bacterium]|nr:MAG: dihydrolipoyllysine-residue acetyltransferase [Halieaceae bacterium]CAI8398991.1 MAG: Dihydrolipoyllysine-residue acetyltransferase component of pyruvate dehydrogenase complex [Halieaceae bacterium]